MGVLDDYNSLEDQKPAIELYAPHRPSWVTKVGGADQKANMPGSESVDDSMIGKLKESMGVKA